MIAPNSPVCGKIAKHGRDRAEGKSRVSGAGGEDVVRHHLWNEAPISEVGKVAASGIMENKFPRALVAEKCSIDRRGALVGPRRASRHGSVASHEQINTDIRV